MEVLVNCNLNADRKLKNCLIFPLGAFNPARIFGPSVYSGKWKYFYLYYIGQYSGSWIAALMVHYVGTGASVFKVKEIAPQDVGCHYTPDLEANEAFEQPIIGDSEESPLLLQKYREQHHAMDSASHYMNSFIETHSKAKIYDRKKSI